MKTNREYLYLLLTGTLFLVSLIIELSGFIFVEPLPPASDLGHGFLRSLSWFLFTFCSANIFDKVFAQDDRIMRTKSRIFTYYVGAAILLVLCLTIHVLYSISTHVVFVTLTFASVASMAVIAIFTFRDRAKFYQHKQGPTPC